MQVASVTNSSRSDGVRSSCGSDCEWLPNCWVDRSNGLKMSQNQTPHSIPWDIPWDILEHAVEHSDHSVHFFCKPTAEVLREVVASAWGSEAAKAIRATSPPTDGPACMRTSAAMRILSGMNGAYLCIAMDSSMWRLLPCTLHAYRSFRHWLKALERYWKAVHTIHKLFLIVRRTWGARGPVQGAARWAPNPLPWRVRNGWKLSGSYISYISYRIDRKHPNFKPIDMNSGNQTDSVPWATATLQHVGGSNHGVPVPLCASLRWEIWPPTWHQ